MPDVGILDISMPTLNVSKPAPNSQDGASHRVSCLTMHGPRRLVREVLDAERAVAS